MFQFVFQSKSNCCTEKNCFLIPTCHSNEFTYLFRIEIDKRASDGIQASPQAMNAIVTTGSHARSTSYSVSYCTRKTTTNLPIENKGKKRDCDCISGIDWFSDFNSNFNSDSNFNPDSDLNSDFQFSKKKNSIPISIQSLQEI